MVAWARIGREIGANGEHPPPFREEEADAERERIATRVGPSGIDIAYERRGYPGDPAVLLIMGIAAQLVHWPEGFQEALRSAPLLASPRTHVRREG